MDTNNKSVESESSKIRKMKFKNTKKIAEALGYTWNKKLKRWDFENGFTTSFNPFDNNNDCELVKNKLREDGYLITLQDKVDYMGDYISSGKMFNKKNPNEDYYTESLNDRYTTCYLALKVYV